jgi:hypothetical protein
VFSSYNKLELDSKKCIVLYNVCCDGWDWNYILIVMFGLFVFLEFLRKGFWCLWFLKWECCCSASIMCVPILCYCCCCLLFFYVIQVWNMLYNQTYNLDRVQFAAEGIKEAQQTVCSQELFFCDPCIELFS